MALFTRTRKRKKQIIKKRIMRILKWLMLAILAGIIYSFGVAVYENIKVDQALKAFKARAEFEYQTEVETLWGVWQTRYFYKVSRETSYELADERSVFNTPARVNLGQKGDIFVTRQSPFPHVRWFDPFMSNYFGGHAAIHDGDNRFIEATGFPGEDESLLGIILHPGDQPHEYSVVVSRSATNYWLTRGYRPETDEQYPYYGSHYRTKFVGLRVKYVTEDQIDGVVDFGNQLIENEMLYNFLFFLDMRHKYYCTDLVSRAYQHVMVPEDKQRSYARALNDDRFITSVNDMILSNDTYIHFYVEIINEEAHIYYLEDL